MPSNQYVPLEKLLNPTAGPPGHSSIKDEDLQIQTPIPLEMNDFDKINRFKALHTRLERGPVTRSHREEKVEPSANPVSAMEEAQNTYETIMEIRKQLSKAYQEFMHMQ